MLKAHQRLRSPADFSLVTRQGRRGQNGALVVYLLIPQPIADSSDREAGESRGVVRGPTAGLIVGKSVGNSVVRHRVSRRLREQLRAQLTGLGPGDRLVVRALPASAALSSSDLGRDLAGAVRRARRPRQVSS